MIDSSHTETLYDVIQQFREYITQNHGADSKTAQAYIRIADDFQQHVSNKDSSVPPELAVQEYYKLTVGVPPFEAPPSKSKERYARAIRMIHDILHNEEPKRRYVNYPLRCPAPYQDILSRYESVMRDDQKSHGTIRTRSGRMKVFFVFLADRECVALETLRQCCLLTLSHPSGINIHRKGRLLFYIQSGTFSPMVSSRICYRLIRFPF